MKNPDIKSTVEHVADLARLRFPADKLDLFAAKVKAVISYVEQLSELDAAGIEPTSHAVETGSSLRADEAVSSQSAEGILAAVPESDGPFVQVPRVIESE